MDLHKVAIIERPTNVDVRTRAENIAADPSPLAKVPSPPSLIV